MSGSYDSQEDGAYFDSWEDCKLTPVIHRRTGPVCATTVVLKEDSAVPSPAISDGSPGLFLVFGIPLCLQASLSLKSLPSDQH